MLELTWQGRPFRLPEGATFGDAVKAAGASGEFPALGAAMGRRLYALGETIPGDGAVCFVDIRSEEGSRIYARSASFLLVRAVRELFDGARVIIDHSLNRSFYCEAVWKRRLTARDIRSVEDRMREIATLDEPFEPLLLPADQAREAFLRDGRQDVADLIPQQGEFACCRCGGFVDAWYGPLAPSTGCLKLFRLQFYLPGFLLMFPNSFSPSAVPDFAETPKLAAAFHESAEWDRLVGVSRIADLNRVIREGRGREIVRMCETRQEGRLARIADLVCRERRRVILIAGPSSSGKTTFAQRLMVHLRACGLTPLALSLDDYYLDRGACPRNPDGTFDLESIAALNVPLFEEQLSALLSGEEVALAKFDFLSGKSGRAAERTSVRAGQPLLVEGINGLNDRLTQSIPTGVKFRIYVSALTQLNIDDHNRVSTADLRLIRRIVRDSLYRGRKAEGTIEDWPAVHGAEFRNIYPNQENADALFNSALAYELSALRALALPLLEGIPTGHPSRPEAERLSAFLSLADPLPCVDEIPPTSILREFIGGCTFYGTK